MLSNSYPPPLDIFSLVKTNPYLVVDTSLYPPEFQAALLTRLSKDFLSLDAATDGLLIHSDNFQALNLLQARYREQVKCIYIDPPYNTNASPIIYKNGYRHSSWISLLENRISLGLNLGSQSSIQFTAIDHAELFNLGELQDSLFKEENRIAIIPIQHNPKGRNQAVFFSENCEYMFCYAKNITHAKFNQIAIDQEVLDTFTETDEDGKFRYENFIRARTSWSRKNKPNNWYPLYVSPDLSKITREKKEDYSELYPITENGEFSWKNIGESFDSLNKDNYFKAVLEDEKITIYHKYREQQVFKNFWPQKKYQSEFNGTNLLKNIIGSSLFNFPKSIFTILDSIKIVSSKTDLILDYFAGSGTTAHAVINLNREDGGKRKYILVEQAEYFNTVLKPRMQKVIYSKEWKDGKPQADDDGNFHGVPQIVKVLKLESYEDTLNNLQLKKPDLLTHTLNEQTAQDYLLHYMLDMESRDSLLSTDDFCKPFDYRLNIATDSAGAYTPQVIDLVETFNYLLGLRVDAVEDRRFDKGYVFVEGHLDGERILLVWRDCERWDYDGLQRLLAKKKIKPQESEFAEIYINGDHTLPTVWQDNDAEGGMARTLKIRSIEAEFLRLMFAEAE